MPIDQKKLLDDLMQISRSVAEILTVLYLSERLSHTSERDEQEYLLSLLMHLLGKDTKQISRSNHRQFAHHPHQQGGMPDEFDGPYGY